MPELRPRASTHILTWNKCTQMMSLWLYHACKQLIDDVYKSSPLPAVKDPTLDGGLVACVSDIYALWTCSFETSICRPQFSGGNVQQCSVMLLRIKCAFSDYSMDTSEAEKLWLGPPWRGYSSQRVWVLNDYVTVLHLLQLKSQETWSLKTGELQSIIIVCDKQVYTGGSHHKLTSYHKLSAWIFLLKWTWFLWKQRTTWWDFYCALTWHVANWALSFPHQSCFRQGQCEVSALIQRANDSIAGVAYLPPLFFSSSSLHLTIHDPIHNILL